MKLHSLFSIGLRFRDQMTRKVRRRRAVRLFEALENRRMLATFLVTNLNDSMVGSAGDAPGSLRQAIFDANALPGSDTISFQPDLSGTINLLGSQLQITDSLSINGPGPDRLAIDAQQQSRVMHVSNGSQDVALSGLTIRGGAAGVSADGGGILFESTGALTLSQSVVIGNAARTGGGINMTSGTAKIVDSTIDGNHSSGQGGGINLATAGGASLLTTTVSGNTAGNNGAGIYALDSGTVTLSSSTVSGNKTTWELGGGVAVFNTTIDIANSTISGNESRIEGGGVFSMGGPVSVHSSTITANKVTASNGQGGGLFIRDSDLNSHLTLLNSIVSGNFTPAGISDLISDPDDTPTESTNLIGPVRTNKTHFDFSNIFNSDAIINNGGSQSPFDAIQDAPDSHSLMTNSFDTLLGAGMPDDGVIDAEFGELDFDVPLGYSNDDDGNNALALRSATDSATLTLPQSQQFGYSEFIVYAHNTEGDGTLTVELRYADGSVTSTNRTIDYWFDDDVDDGVGGLKSSDTQYLINDLGRANNDGTNLEFAIDAAIFFVRMPVDPTKTLESIQFSRAPGGVGNHLVIYGATGISQDSMLGPLQHNAGPTQTHALLQGSPAIDGGDSSLLPSDSNDLDNDGNTSELLSHDQRGATRVIGSGLDIGAFEAATKFHDDGSFALFVNGPPGFQETAVPFGHNGGNATSIPDHFRIPDVQVVEVYDNVPGTTNYPLTFVDQVASTFGRITYQNADGTTGALGTSFIATAAFRPAFGDFQPIPTISSVNVTTAGTDRYVSTAVGDFGTQMRVTSTKTFSQPEIGKTQVDVNVKAEVLEEILITGVANSDAFRFLTLSSMFANESQFDANMIRYADPTGQIHTTSLTNQTARDAHLFPAGTALGSWFELVKSEGSTWHPESPTIRVDITDAGGQSLAIQGFQAATTNPNDDSLNVWVERNSQDSTIQPSTMNFSFKIAATEPTAQGFDFGDAPVSFPVTLEQNGARHATGSLTLGSAIDAEQDGVPGAGASSDGVDDDGITSLATAIASPTTPTMSSFAVTSSSAGKLDAWIDFNANGTWDANEQIFSGVSVPQGTTPLSYTIPQTASHGGVAARFRLSTAGGLAPTGLSLDGEVEDYIQMIEAAGNNNAAVTSIVPGAVTIEAVGNSVVVRDGNIVLFQAPTVQLAILDFTGSSGDDVIHLAASLVAFRDSVRLHGGNGNDMLQVSGSEQVLDLTTLPSNALSHVEAIDIRGSGSNSLMLSSTNIDTIPDPGSLLQVFIDKDDVLEITDGNFEITTSIIQQSVLLVEAQSGSTTIQIGGLDWTNPLNRLDVNASGVIEPIDALQVINLLNTRDAKFVMSNSDLISPQNLTVDFPMRFVDTTADGILAPIDALRVINFLNRSGLGEAPTGESVPQTTASLTPPSDHAGTQVRPDEEPLDISFAKIIHTLSVQESASSIPRQHVTTEPPLAVNASKAKLESVELFDQVLAEWT